MSFLAFPLLNTPISCFFFLISSVLKAIEFTYLTWNIQKPIVRVASRWLSYARWSSVTSVGLQFWIFPWLLNFLLWEPSETPNLRSEHLNPQICFYLSPFFLFLVVITIYSAVIRGSHTKRCPVIGNEDNGEYKLCFRKQQYTPKMLAYHYKISGYFFFSRGWTYKTKSTLQFWQQIQFETTNSNKTHSSALILVCEFGVEISGSKCVFAISYNAILLVGIKTISTIGMWNINNKIHLA